ncbi:MAG: DNA-binding protein [Tannerella sp.]|jgi:hypothetical protein|nr:DNA-binding protein [Tannerella sp.]
MDNKISISTIERQNVLNNRFAVEAIQKALNIEAMFFDDQYCFTKKMVADFYEVDERTIERYLESYEQELKHNGYFLCKGKLLKEFRLHFVSDINVAHKVRSLGLFNFRAFLNLGMLLTESEKAKQVRNLILDVVIATLNERTGGGTKFINRRDVNYITSAIEEINYNKVFFNAIYNYVECKEFEFSRITDQIYKVIFKENTKEYKEILQLKHNESAKSTMYAEILLMISAFEYAVSCEIEKLFQLRNQKLLSVKDVFNIIDNFANSPLIQPHLNDARTKMASRDLSFRDAYHGNIAEYLRAVTPEEFERFIGNESIDFDAILEANTEVLKRLKQGVDE